MRRHLTEALIVRLLPRRELPAIVAYAGALGIVLAAALLRYALGGAMIGYPVLLFIPAVFLSALLFDNGAGYLATIVSALIAWGAFIDPAWSFAADRTPIIPLLLFVAIGFVMSAVTEALRRAMRRLDEGKRGKSLMLEELAHRTKNDLAIISAAITLQGNASTDPAVKAALEQANSRVMIVASAQDQLRGDTDDRARLDLAAYVESLCSGLGDLHRGIRPIGVHVDCTSAMVPSSTAITVGLIVNELVTNCFKYAFPDGATGRVKITVVVDGPRIVIDVEDDGVGCDTTVKAGLGSRLVRMLAEQKRGTMTREATNAGCRVRVDLKETSAA
jgi:two-component sensor histidine kinase